MGGDFITIISYSFAIAMVLAIACTILCSVKNKTNRTKGAAIVTGMMCYFAVCFFLGAIAGYY